MDILELSLGAEGIIGLINGEEEIGDLAALQTRAPDAPADALARVASALGTPGYDPILDPADYKTTILARVEKEDPNMPWTPGKMRIRDYGLPDFDTIQPPARNGNTLVYFARDTHTSLPYKIGLTLGLASDPAITPLPLVPFPGDPVPVPATVTNDVLGPEPDEEPTFAENDGDDDLPLAAD